MAITLKAARVNKGFTQEKAAKLLEISKESLGNYESGKTYPDIPVLKRIEQVYEISYNELIFLQNNTIKT